MALLIRAQDGSEEIIAPADRSEGFNLAELYVLIGCDAIEIVPLPDGQMMVIDDEGKFRSPLLLNEKATAMFWKAGGAHWDVIVGNALICSPGELQ